MSKARKLELKKCYAALERASDYAEWQRTAERIDTLSNLNDWREDDTSDAYDYQLVREHLRVIKVLRREGKSLELMRTLNDSVLRLNHDLTRPELFEVALSGTKFLIEEYFDEVEHSLEYLCNGPHGVGDDVKLEHFQRARESLGQTALLLSGGATLGFYHLGVAKALWTNGLLPKIICGSSMGAIIAAAICTRTDAELSDWFESTQLADTAGLCFNSKVLRGRDETVFDQSKLKSVILSNIADLTMNEAHQRTDRVLNVSVSPTRPQQKPKLLNYQTAPNACIGQACLASSAVPGLFPPVVLTQKDHDGNILPYLSTESWIDGSIEGDLPKIRLSRLQNVNHFVVSQTNPHVLPMAHVKSGNSLWSKLLQKGGRFAQVQGAFAMEVLGDVVDSRWGGEWVRRAQNFIAQDYEGDVNIHPRFRLDLYRLMLKNPNEAELLTFIREGEQATYPKLGVIKMQTRVGRIIDGCIGTLRQRLGQH